MNCKYCKWPNGHHKQCPKRTRKVKIYKAGWLDGNNGKKAQSKEWAYRLGWVAGVKRKKETELKGESLWKLSTLNMSEQKSIVGEDRSLETHSSSEKMETGMKLSGNIKNGLKNG